MKLGSLMVGSVIFIEKVFNLHGLGVELLPEAAEIFWFVIDDRQHSAEEEQIAGLQRLHV